MRARDRLPLLSVLSLASLHACAGAPGASSPEPVHLEDWVRVGVSAVEEAQRVREALEAGGWRTTRTIERPAFVALAFSRGPSERAVRVVTGRGVVVALDSHESDGYRERHGVVDLGDDEPADLDGDGTEELLVWRRDGPVPCLVVLRFGARGEATMVGDDAAALRRGACVSRLEDVDDDGRVEAIVPLRWPALTFHGRVPTVEVALVEVDGAWRAGRAPAVYVEREREARRASLSAARGRRDVAGAVVLAVEVAAFGHLTGAARSAQIDAFDRALAGLVLTPAERDQVVAIRAVIAAGWRDSSR